ncbi:MAG: hypothetical protein ACRDJY_08235, partial [Thermoleophilaceae bacterium]
MLDSLHTRPRGRKLAIQLHRLTGGLIKQAPERVQDWEDSPRVSIDLRTREIGADMEPGPVSEHFFGRLGEDVVAEMEGRLEGDAARIWEHAEEPHRKPLAVAFALHYDVPG